jgi:two-component system, OmpR family, copper resistance phosphate regulon response regulator CusR
MRILVVEDDPKINDFLKISLESEYFVVDTVHDGEKGYYLAMTNEYDIIILDFMLPGKLGLEICKELRTNGIQTPIIGLSVKSETVNKVGFLNAGADDYLTKPFSFEELIARIQALLRRPQSIESNIVEIGGIELDSQKHTVRKDGKEIYLTRKEFLLLEYLMKNHGTVLSRGMILEHVWDMNADPFSNTIETHIMTLRRKIDSEQSLRLIRTVPGIGYKIDFS